MRLNFVSIPTLALLAAMSASGQTSETISVAPATAAAVVPNLIRYSGTLTDGRGYPVSVPSNVTFSLYTESTQTGDEKSALWQEVQRVMPDEKGAYTVYLGAASPQGLPAGVFTAVKAQWLGVKVEGEPELARVLLVSVPYALKAGDAQTLGGLPASAYALAGAKTAPTDTIVPAVTPAAAVSDAASNVTTTGGTSKYVPVFNGANTIVDSEIYDTGTSVGIGDIPNPGAKLDIDGPVIMRGYMTVSRTGNATSAKGYPSYGFNFFSSIYNSSTKTNDNAYYSLQSEPTGNNTSSPSATFNLLFANNGAAEAETGLYFNPNGVIHFSPSQTFPGAGTITGVTASTGLSGGGTSGTVTLKNTGILGLTAGTGITSTGGQSPTIAVNSAVVPELALENEFTTTQFVVGGAIIDEDSYIESVNTGNAIAMYAFNNTTSSTEPTLYVENDDSTSAGDLAFEVYGGNTGNNCTIDVTGNLFCTGSLGPAIKKANQTTVAMYSVASAENWVEDFGTAKLVNGVAVVQLNPDLAEAVSADASYHVFPSPNGDCAGLYVTNRTATSFEVHELKGGTSNIEFDYRVVAHRKGFETVRLPDITVKSQARTRPGAGLRTVAAKPKASSLQ